MRVFFRVFFTGQALLGFLEFTNYLGAGNVFEDLRPTGPLNLQAARLKNSSFFHFLSLQQNLSLVLNSLRRQSFLSLQLRLLQAPGRPPRYKAPRAGPSQAGRSRTFEQKCGWKAGGGRRGGRSCPIPGAPHTAPAGVRWAPRAFCGSDRAGGTTLGRRRPGPFHERVQKQPTASTQPACHALVPRAGVQT